MNPEKGDLPTEFQREIGTKWVAAYGHMYKEDPAFVAAAVYRMMRLALSDPECKEVMFVKGLDDTPRKGK